MSDIEITETSNRGFHQYGEPFLCTYGTRLRVYESSSAEAPHVWLNMKADLRVLRDEGRGEATAHLNEEQARALVARLQAWLDEIPERWGAPRREGE